MPMPSRTRTPASRRQHWPSPNQGLGQSSLNGPSDHCQPPELVEATPVSSLYGQVLEHPGRLIQHSSGGTEWMQRWRPSRRHVRHCSSDATYAIVGKVASPTYQSSHHRVGGGASFV
jgi:hypothetical protein